eukprot:351585-Chlamydomonas_euryale.AAC.5
MKTENCTRACRCAHGIHAWQATSTSDGCMHCPLIKFPPQRTACHPPALATDSEVAARYRSFTQAGGVTLVLASLNYEKLQGSQSCSASMALLKSVLGEGRLAGCSCQAIPGGNQDAFAKVRWRAAAG